MTMEVGALIAGGNVDLEYCPLKRWLQKIPTLKGETLSKAEELRVSSSLQDVEDDVPQRGGSTKGRCSYDGGWETCFEEHSHSNTTEQKLLPVALEATEVSVASDYKNWENPSQFQFE